MMVFVYIIVVGAYFFYFVFSIFTNTATTAATAAVVAAISTTFKENIASKQQIFTLFIAYC